MGKITGNRNIRVLVAALLALAVAISTAGAAFAVEAPSTVALDANGGKVSPQAVTVTAGDVYGPLPTPTRKGYAFKGWQADDGSKASEGATVPTPAPKALYAQWKAKAYKTTYNVNFTWPSSAGVPKSWIPGYIKTSKTVTYGKKYGALPTRWRVGYLMKGWYTKKSGGKKITSSTKASITKNTTYYARWKAASADEIAKAIAKAAKKGKTDKERIQAATDAVAAFTAQNRYTTSEADYNNPTGVFVKGASSCAGATRALGLVLTYMGYSWEHVNPNQWTHQWCRVHTSSGTMWADADSIHVGQDGEIHGTTGTGERSL
ncbi:MAG: InlB B-repeat-containing protein [Clostridiales Family XIII bacterium]|jgi:uncharacterized repeat protein (TIGR02543 family)|nr:InlB B-repeat-containing protein [Clostridiales Family XIII bacterium]